MGVDRNANEALGWLRKSAAQGFKPAIQEVASCLRSGSLGTTDKAEAAEWERKLQ
jgi:TPR repeat protein